MTGAEMEALRSHRCHDAAHLIRRWKAVGRAARLVCRTICQAAGFPVLALHSRRDRRAGDGIYLSAGVHGDEPAAVCGLLAWAEENEERLAQANVFLVPLFNPGGLVANTRVDEDGVDLNRLFHDRTHPHIGAWHAALSGWRFRLGVMLHEDYDAQGIYCYELNAGEPLAEAFLQQAQAAIPRDARTKIDGRSARGAIIRRGKAPVDLPGLPEAIQLYHHGADATLTFETPSEFSLTDRINAHKLFIDAVFTRFGM
jgi:hypothetical protein